MEENKSKKTIILIALTIVTLVLGGIALLTAWRLKQLSTVPVAPTAPESQPQAQVITGGACEVSFSIPKSVCRGWCDDNADCGTGFICWEGSSSSPVESANGICLADTTDCKPEEQNQQCQCPPPPPSGEVACVDKSAYRDSMLNVLIPIVPGETVERGETIVYRVHILSGLAGLGATLVDPLNSNLTFVDAVSPCQWRNSRVECTHTGAVDMTYVYRAKVNQTVPYGTMITNTATVTDANGVVTTCAEQVVLKAEPTPTVTITPTPGPSSTPTPGPSSTPTPKPSATPTTEPTLTPGPTATSAPNPTATPVPPAGCNMSCTSNGNCQSNLICSGGYCRNSSCTAETDCVCPSPTNPPAPSNTPRPIVPTNTPTPQLPTAGVSGPGLAILSLGLLVILMGMGVLLVW